MPRLAISLFGLFHVMLDGTPVTEFKTNKVLALLQVCAGVHWNDRLLQTGHRPGEGIERDSSVNS